MIELQRELQLPFAPFEGLHITFGDNEWLAPSQSLVASTISGVLWSSTTNEFFVDMEPGTVIMESDYMVQEARRGGWSIVGDNDAQQPGTSHDR